MGEIRNIAEKFYISITNGETQVVEDLLSDDFELINLKQLLESVQKINMC